MSGGEKKPPGDDAVAPSAVDTAPDDQLAEVAKALKPYLRPGKDLEQALTEVSAIIVSERHSGPLPSPRSFGQYEDILPGAADRILSMAEKEQQHRHDVDDDLLTKEFSLRRWGQVLAFLALVALIIVIGLMAHWGHARWASLLGGVTIVSVVSAFLGLKLAKPKDEISNPPVQNSRNEHDRARVSAKKRRKRG